MADSSAVSRQDHSEHDDAPAVLGRLPQSVPNEAMERAGAAGLPANLVLTERATAELRAFLADEGCGHWTVFHAMDDEVYDVDRFREKLEPTAEWVAPPGLTGIAGAGEAISVRSHDSDAARHGEFDSPGFLLLREWGVCIARWYWVDPEYNAPDTLWLMAAKNVEDYQKLRDRIRSLRHGGNVAVWQIVRGHASHDGPRLRRRKTAGDELILTDKLRDQIERDVLGFYKPAVRKLYKKLDVPYRRGVLLHGPPGNGKTSLIRMIGARLPKLPFLIVRPDRQIDAGAMRVIIDRWQKQAPAVLVIEDLNWLLEHVDVSQFLNLIDGIERPSAKGLLLLATTNYPERLDPAVNNRPGRFDVTIELPGPDRELRDRFFNENLPELDESARDKAADDTDGLSFAHLREILRLSGLLAIEAGREERTADELAKAVTLVHESHDHAIRGFPKPPEVPFGLQHSRRGR